MFLFIRLIIVVAGTYFLFLLRIRWICNFLGLVWSKYARIFMFNFTQLLFSYTLTTTTISNVNLCIKSLLLFRLLLQILALQSCHVSICVIVFDIGTNITSFTCFYSFNYLYSSALGFIMKSSILFLSKKLFQSLSLKRCIRSLGSKILFAGDDQVHFSRTIAFCSYLLGRLELQQHSAVTKPVIHLHTEK